MEKTTIVLAGATGDLGERILNSLLQQGAHVKALVRQESLPEKVNELQNAGAEISVVDFGSQASVAEACSGAACVVSALSGLREVIVEMQTVLLNAAVEAGVPRFIPSDFSIDFTKLPDGTNRNLDLRREFHQSLDKASIAATTIFNGAFTELLTGEMPVILFKIKRILAWGNADQLFDFTTKDNTAAYTAAAALDSSTPRFLRVAGDQISCRDLMAISSEVTGDQFRLLRPGGLGMLNIMIKVMRRLMPSSQALYPPWQGMQYMHNMCSGLAKLEPLDNDRYPAIKWTAARNVIASRSS
jgi:uncharacterized protein YbjT (DUF2867 family)